MPSLRAARLARRPAVDVFESRIVPDTTPTPTPTPGPTPPPAPPPPGAPPLAVDDQGAYDITAPSSPVNVLANDLDGNPGATWDYSSVTVVTGPTAGVLNLDPVSGGLLYTPNYMLPPGLPPGAPPPATPQDTFTYYVKDSLGLKSNTATVTLSPNAGAGGGLIIPRPDIGVVHPTESVTVDILANDYLGDGSSFILSSVGFVPGATGPYFTPQHGTVTFDPQTGKATYTPDFGYLGWDTFSYSVRTTSGFQAGDLVTILINPGPPRLVTDPAGGGQMLVVDGTNAADTISIVPAGRCGEVRAIVNGVASPPFRPDTKIEVFGYAGDDTITVSPTVRTPVWLIGGFGDDTLKAGGGPTLLMGSEGNDILIGGRSRDIMIGGAGADFLVGGPGDDVLIGGSTRFDQQPDALARVFAAWTDDRHRWGWCSAGAASPFLPSDLIDDGAKDTLAGGNRGDLDLGTAGNPPDDVIGPPGPGRGRGHGRH